MSPELMLFQAALGLTSPWQVSRSEFRQEAQELHLWIDFPRGSRFSCPECPAECRAYDTEERTWRHLNFFQHKTYLHARFPRVNCSACGVKTVEAPWARSGSGFTLLFEAFVLTLCREMTVSAAARIVGEHDTRLWRILEAYVETARQEQEFSGVTQLGVDETACKSGHDYVSVFADLKERRVLYVTSGRDATVVKTFKETFQAQSGDPSAVEAVCMDMWPAYIGGFAQEFGSAVEVFDRFHVMKIVNAALDAIRRAEVKENLLLKQTRYLWLKNPVNLTEKQRERLEPLKAMNLGTATAYQMKLNLQELWEQPDRQSAEAFLFRWCEWVEGSEIGRAMKKAAQTIRGHATGILNYFTVPITNGLMEGINSLIQAAKSKARGYRTHRNFCTIIYLIAGKLRFPLPT